MKHTELHSSGKEQISQHQKASNDMQSIKNQDLEVYLFTVYMAVQKIGLLKQNSSCLTIKVQSWL